MSSLQELLLALPAYADRRALGVRGNFGFRWWSYSEVHALALRAAHLFADRGLEPGTRILLWSANTPEWIACLLGAAWRGLVVIPIDARERRGEVERFIVRTGAALLLFGEDQYAGQLGIQSLRLAGLESYLPSSVHDVRALRVPVRDDDAAVVLYTAGTSGEPRGVILTHGNLRSQIGHFSYWQPLLRLIPTRLLALSPLSHVQGLMLSGCVPLSLGMTVIHTPSIEPEHLQRCLREGRVRALSTVPRVLATLQASLAARARQKKRHPNFMLRRSLLGARFHVILVGGATLPGTAERFWRRLGCVVVQGYGSTETTAFATVNRPLVGRFGSIGASVHRGSLLLSPEGEVLVRGPHVSPGYLGEDPATVDTQRTVEGYLRTGDLARRDARGRIFFLGRMQDRIVTAEGHTLHPDGIETVLRESEGVQDALVMPWARGGLEELHAVLLMVPGKDHPSAPQTIAAANLRLPEAARIRSWTVYPEADFPRGALGKPRREQITAHVLLLRERGEQAPTQSVTRPDTLDNAAEEPDRPARLLRVRDCLLPTPEMWQSFGALHAVLRPLGMDSVDTAEVLTLLRAEGGGSTDLAKGSDPGEFPPPSSAPRRSPRWQHWPGAGLLRWLVRGAVLRLARIGVRVRSRGILPARTSPVLFAIHGDDREHGVEYLATLMCLPRRFQKRLIAVSGDRLIFGSHFYRKPEDSFWTRLYAGFMARFGVPSVLPYILFLGSTVEGIAECCQALDRGFCPLVKWNRVAAIIACETGAAVVPMRMRGPRESWRRADLEIEFGDAITPLRSQSAVDFRYAVAERMEAMTREYAFQA